ncbi:MAG: enoyl-CoA hydratase/isomerase family protein [Euryarchaeota archaeon]|nr:enoyl-CoA hydratase/isomerase family protein [Euryarchaeota archaeon]
MPYQTLLVEHRGPAGWVILNRPERQNSISPQLTHELIQALREMDANPEVRVVVITGAGDRVFSAGGDLGSGPEPGPMERHMGHMEFAELSRILVGLSKPTIARVNGHAMGGGFGIAAGCDITIAVPEATLGTPEITIGLFPHIIMATLHRTTTNPKRLLEMMLLGERIPAEEARALGWVTHVVPRDQLDAKVSEVVEKLASKSPAVLALGRRTYYAMREMEWERALDYLAATLTLNSTLEDTREGILAFREKRAPKWKGR